MILLARAESIILSAGGVKHQSNKSCSSNVAMMAGAEATVAVVTDLTLVAAVTTVVMEAMGTAMLTVTAATVMAVMTTATVTMEAAIATAMEKTTLN
jgi:hypothetical protein